MHIHTRKTYVMGQVVFSVCLHSTPHPVVSIIPLSFIAYIGVSVYWIHTSFADMWVGWLALDGPR